jgi:T4 bacteriophage base plate protein
MNNNPLKQYFRRPSVYLKLPSGGKGYSPEVLEATETGELPVYPMTAIDEITTKTPDALFNGTAVVEVIKSCIPNIKDPWQISSIDLDAILISIRAASGGNDFEIDSKCPKCTNEAKFGLNLAGVLATLKAADYSHELQLGDLTFKFRPLTYKEINEAGIAQFEVQRLFDSITTAQNDQERAKFGEIALKGITDLTMRLVSIAIEYIKTPNTIVTEKEYILDFLQNCDKNIYTEVRDYNSKLKGTTELKPLDIKCVECGNEYQQPYTLNTSDFFA